ncbi:MAG: sulfotransferase domain-containing protein [Pseudomonadales bacterium]|nr:sulfotransferase domain-containing protein [Pseudomonadales bacterium]
MGSESAIICIGAQRAGTTWLYRVLKENGLRVGHQKEVDYFRYLGNYDRGFDWYVDQFPKSKGPLIDITPEYAIASEAPDLIERSFGLECKILFFVREPLSRIESAYQKHRRNGEINCSLEFFAKYDWDSCVQRSLYSDTIQRFSRFKKLEVLVYEDMRFDSIGWANKVAEIFELSPSVIDVGKQFNPSLRSGGLASFLNPIYRPLSKFGGVRSLKSSLESLAVVNRLLYPEPSETNTLELPRSVVELLHQDRDKCSKLINRNLNDTWGS